MSQRPVPAGNEKKPLQKEKNEIETEEKEESSEQSPLKRRIRTVIEISRILMFDEPEHQPKDSLALSRTHSSA